ncbi:MAG: hypothetical protein L6R36_003580 [Xanthoria steineri]|nr:MAG: hypothetical protein L6R36_003580 [Xanthoria steineri]
MGQRHQLFIIARINGRYRQLCAIHHQWLYGHTALRRCRDTLSIFSNATNRLPIQQELIAASKKDDDFWLDSDDDEKNARVPFPFIMTCLVMGSSFNVDGYYHGVSVEPFYMAYNRGNNNNGKSPARTTITLLAAKGRPTRGMPPCQSPSHHSKRKLNLIDVRSTGITVFDITKLDNVRYCFIDFMGMESKREVELNNPLSARTYLEAYYVLEETEDEVGLLPLVESFEGKDLITVPALRETWPHGAWDRHSPSSVAGPGSDLDLADPPDLGGLKITDVPGDSSATMANARESNVSVEEEKPKSLRDQAMDRLLDVLLDPSEQDVPTLMAEADHLHDFIAKLRQRLYNQASVLEPSGANIVLLNKAFEGATIVDLSPFSALTSGHLATLVARLRKGHGAMEVLNLSNMPDLTESDLELILDVGNGSETLSITAILLLETPKISLDFVAHHLGNHDVYHSELFRRALYKPPYSVSAFNRDNRSLLPPLQFDAPESISQLVLIGISTRQSCDVQLRLEDGRFDWSRMKFFSEEVEDSTITYMNFPLDIPLRVSKQVQILQRLLQYMPRATSFNFENCIAGTAHCFATTSLLEDDGYSVGPLSQTLSEDRQQPRSPEEKSGKDQYLKPGRWAIVVIHEAFNARDQDHADRRVGETAFKPLKGVRYLLAQAIPKADSSGPHYLIMDVPGYIEHMSKDVEQVRKMQTCWTQAGSAFPAGTGYYDESDAQAIVDRVYSKEEFGTEDPV